MGLKRLRRLGGSRYIERERCSHCQLPQPRRAPRSLARTHRRLSIKLSPEQCGELARLITEGYTQAEAARYFGMDQSSISRLLARMTDAEHYRRALLCAAASVK